jgi:hypothetical protein
MEELSRADRDALRRALTIARAESDEERAHLDHIEGRSGWQEAAESAVYHLQCKALRLRPWEPPPCWIRDLEADLAAGDDGVGGRFRAAKLTQRLLKANLSRFEPDPLAALAQAEDARMRKEEQAGQTEATAR